MADVDTAAARALAARIVPTRTTRHDHPLHQPALGASIQHLADRSWYRTAPRPTCSLTGNPAPLARIIDPIDVVDYGHDIVKLIAAQRSLEHQAKVLALVAIGWTPEP